MRTALVLLASLLTGAPLCWSATWVVDAGGGGDFLTIQEAIDAASSGDEIIVNPGTYYELINYQGKDLNIHSVDGPAVTVIDGAHTGSCVTFASGETQAAILDGFSVTHGDGTETNGPEGRIGGAVYISGSPTLRDCWFLENVASNGGAIYVYQGQPEIDACIFRDNLAEGYGSCISGPYCRAYAHDCLFEDNHAVEGDGTIHLGLNAVIADCVFRNNTARQGGAVNCGGYGADAAMIGCVFEGNRATGVHGGAVRSHEASPILDRCFFIDNWAAEDGGGILALDGGTAKIGHCTFYRNGAGRYGGNIALWNGTVGEIENCIIVEGLAGGGVFCSGASAQFECNDTWNNAGGNYVGIDDPTGVDGNISEDPLFCDPEDGYFGIHLRSPCAPENQPICGLLGAYPVECRNYVVNPEGTGDVPTIQAALDACVNGDGVDLTDGTFTGDGNRDIDFLGKTVCVRSLSGDPTACIIDCQGSEEDPHRGFIFDSREGPESELNGVTIVNGFSPGPSYHGGAIICNGSAPTIIGCVMTGNVADVGGAVWCTNVSAPVFDRCTFDGNAARQGGAIACDFSLVELPGCTLYGNCAAGAPSAAGGIACTNYGDAELENTIIAFGGEGQAAHCEGSGAVTLTCCDVYGNAGGDWTDCITDQYGVTGNFSADPRFCDPENGNYYLWNSSPCNNETCGLIGAWPIGCEDPQGEGSTWLGAQICPRLTLDECAPNPFGRVTRIGYVIPWNAPGARVVLDIYDATGRRACRLTDEWQPIGRHSVTWDGTDESGARLSSGAYFCRIRAGSESATRQLVLVR